MGLILAFVFWLIIDKIKKKNYGKENFLQRQYHVYKFLADTKHYVPIKLMVVAGNPEISQSGPAQISDIHYQTFT